jgi:hypothetical protein
MAKNVNFDVEVVVSGQTFTIKVNENQKVEQLVKEALKESGNKGQPPSEWELRTTDGALIDQSLRIEDAGIVPGATLYLSPRAGAGGSI